MKKDFTLEDIGNLITASVTASEERILERVDNKLQEFLHDDVKRLIDNALEKSEARLEMRLTEKFETGLNSLAKITMDRFDALDDKLERFRLDTKEEFRAVRNEIRILESNHGARIAILEEKVL